MPADVLREPRARRLRPGRARRILARRRHLDFVKVCWQEDDAYIPGLHFSAICNRIDQAFQDFRKGESTFLILNVPPRHGKSLLTSKTLPGHFMGEFPGASVIVSSYGQDLASHFSKEARRLVYAAEYQKIYPGSCPVKDESGIGSWAIVRQVNFQGFPQKRISRAQFVGLGGSMAGKGAKLLILDDYTRSRADAESEIKRQSAWEAFTNDFLTRRSKVCVVIVLATRWHSLDIVGRIEKKMAEDKDFPKFEKINFPAFREDYPKGVLWPERLGEAWYREQSAALGSYGRSSILQGEPILKSGNFLKTERVVILDSPEAWNKVVQGLRFVRGWDLASSAKELVKDDPDYTVGVKAAFRRDEGQLSIFVDHVERGQWEGPERDRKIQAAALSDGENVMVGVEAFGAYKDAYLTAKNALRGRRSVVKINAPGDKVAKATPLETAFDEGKIYIKKGYWNEAFLKGIGEFPSGAHDDDVDALSVAYYLWKRGGSGEFIDL